MQQEVELSKQRHEGDLKEKERLARMMDNKVILSKTLWLLFCFLAIIIGKFCFLSFCLLQSFLEDITGYGVGKRPFTVI